MFAKRILDLFLCCLSLPNDLPWVPICTLGERVSSAGSVLSGGKQIRLNRRPFEVLSLAACISARHIPRTVTGRFELGPGRSINFAGIIRTTQHHAMPQLSKSAFSIAGSEPIRIHTSS
jgi:hypothetical protein